MDILQKEQSCFQAKYFVYFSNFFILTAGSKPDIMYDPSYTTYMGIGLSTITPLKPNDIYKCRTAALTSRHYILNIYSTNIHTEYFKHAA